VKLCLRELAVSFRGPAGDRLPAFGPLSFEVAENAFVCVLGPSGCGKSTLIRALAGLQPASAGAAYWGGRPIEAPLPGFAIMFQDANLMPWRSTRDNIALPLEIAGLPKAQRYAIVDALLPQLHLEGFAEAYPGELSGGMAQRAALGRVIVQQPRVWLLDEPFGALDALTREKLSLDLLRLRARSQQTILMVTHDIYEAALLADRILVLSRRPGQLVADISVALPRPRSASSPRATSSTPEGAGSPFGASTPGCRPSKSGACARRARTASRSTPAIDTAPARAAAILCGGTPASAGTCCACAWSTPPPRTVEAGPWTSATPAGPCSIPGSW